MKQLMVGFAKLITAVALLVSVVISSSSAKTASFYLKPGDRVVFYGDSITDQRLYTTYIESYCVSRFPNAHYTFIHSGWGGDRVTGGGGGPIDTRLKRDVLIYKPNVVTICLGMNDGSYQAFNQGIFETYVKGYRHILDTLIKELPGVRITLLTASAFDDVTRAPKFLGGYNATLVAYGEAVRSLGKEYGLTVADTNGPLVAALARANSVNATMSEKIIPDHVHPGPGGHLLMAAAVLNAWNAPSTVATTSIKVSGNSISAAFAKNAKFSGATFNKGVLSFTQTEMDLPWPLDRDPYSNPDLMLTLQVTDVEKDYNRYTLQVSGLTSSTYYLTVDGIPCGSMSAAELAAGVNLAAIPALPENVQAAKLLAATRKHNDLHFKRWRQVQITAKSDGLLPSTEVQAQMDSLDTEDAKAVLIQRGDAQTTAHKFVLTPSV